MDWQNTIKIQSKEIEDKDKTIGEFQETKMVLLEDQKIIRKQSTNILNLELMIVKYQEKSRPHNNVPNYDLDKNNCNIDPWDIRHRKTK